MTIRDNIKNQKRVTNMLLFIPIIIFIGIAQIEAFNLYLKSLHPGLLVPILIALYSMFFSYMMKRIKCPSCGYSFATLSIKQTEKHQVNVCPHCTVNLDSE